MRIFLEGNQDLAKWHLPVAEAKFKAFVEMCKESGLKQDRFTFVFSEDGTTVYGQYYFGQESLQVYAPSRRVVTEKSKGDLSDETKPKVFYVNTSKGYFWVEVRYVDNAPKVILTPFVAVVGDEFVYPGFTLNAPGMLAGNFGDTQKARYVLAQNGGVIGTELGVPGAIKSTAIIDKKSKITVAPRTTVTHDYVLMKSDGGKTAEVRRIKISADAVERLYFSINMTYEGETNLYVSTLRPNPCWIHRKCFGSYFSPNKTIGYHVDIGVDDEFLGNMQSITGGDLLDNTGGANESLFNHTPDLYRFASLLCFPLDVDDNDITLVMVSPTMGFADGPGGDKKCWGGYGITQTDAGCADYQRDFTSWLLSPRLVVATINTATGVPVFTELTSGKFKAESWCKDFSMSVIVDMKYDCGNVFFEQNGSELNGTPCRVDVECGGNCGVGNDPVGFNGNCPVEFSTWQHWALFFRENLRVQRHLFLCFGSDTPAPSSPAKMDGYYFMFDGLWHLDVGVHYSNETKLGNTCTLCSVPAAGQTPGELVYFTFGSNVDPNFVLQSGGHEYVQNLEVVAPLGWHDMPDGTYNVSSSFGFIAKVPESLAAPVEPVILVGGVEFASPEVDGSTVKCERYLMSRPCDCDTNQMILGQYSSLTLNSLTAVYVEGGCAPFIWVASSGHFQEDIEGTVSYGSRVVTDDTGLYIMSGGCHEKVTITDACARVVSIEANAQSAYINGPDVLAPGSSAVFSLSATITSPIYYSGGLEFINQSGVHFTLRMPDNSCGGEFTVSLSWCGFTAEKKVRPTDGRWVLIYNGLYGGVGCMDFIPVPGNNAWIEQPYSGARIESTAYHGKYYIVDAVGTYGVTSGIFTAEECEDRFSAYGATQQGIQWATTNIADYINDKFLNNPDVALARYPGFPFVRAALSWSGRYGYYLFNNYWYRNIYEWVC
ncbi:hypothetical protein LLG39_08905 [bacterium]|nr:hypothetical protein [bacterium]